VLGDHLDRRLDLDDLDAPLDLEAIGDELGGPLLGERIRARLEESGALPWVRRHRALVTALSALVAVAAVGGAYSWARRPPPLPEHPRLVLTSNGPDGTAVVVGGAAPSPVLTQALTLTSAERPGVETTLLGLVGPGLAPDPQLAPEAVDPSAPGLVHRTSARLSCATSADLTEVLLASTDSYAVSVRRTSPDGESRVDPVGLRDAGPLLAAVRQRCLQAGADRDLVVRGVHLGAVLDPTTRLPLTDQVAVTLDVPVAVRGGRTWVVDRVVAPPGSAFVSGSEPTVATPDTPAVLHVELHPSDCAHPLADVADGLPVQAFPADTPTVTGTDTPTVHLPLPATARLALVQDLTTLCGTLPVTAVVDPTRLLDGASGTSAGTIEIPVRFAVPRAFALDIDDVTTAAGRLYPAQAHVDVSGGYADATLTWEVPACLSLVDTGLPRVSVRAPTVVGDQVLSRPFRVELRGEELRIAVDRLCGGQVAAAVLRAVPSATPTPSAG
jgi:hypothetical protein